MRVREKEEGRERGRGEEDGGREGVRVSFWLFLEKHSKISLYTHYENSPRNQQPFVEHSSPLVMQIESHSSRSRCHPALDYW